MSVPQALHLGEGAGWGALAMGALGVAGAAGKMVGAITPDVVNQWLLLVGGTISGGVGLGIVLYSRIRRARTDGDNEARIAAAMAEARIEQIKAAWNRNVQAINEGKTGKDLPFPDLLPKADEPK